MLLSLGVLGLKENGLIVVTRPTLVTLPMPIPWLFVFIFPKKYEKRESFLHILFSISVFFSHFARGAYAPVDIIIGPYGSIFNHFQTFNEKSVLKNSD